MKRSTIATLATIALLGGGAYAVTQIPSDEPVATATTEPGVIESPAASESPTPASTETAAAPTDAEQVELTADEAAPQAACREYVASKWENAEYPTEREDEWAVTVDGDSATATWILVAVPDPEPGESWEKVGYDCTVSFTADTPSVESVWTR